jgi:hypothetical protein
MLKSGKLSQIGGGNMAKIEVIIDSPPGTWLPAEVFNSMPVEVTHRGMVESLTQDTMRRTARPTLNIASILSMMGSTSEIVTTYVSLNVNTRKEAGHAVLLYIP